MALASFTVAHVMHWDVLEIFRSKLLLLQQRKFLLLQQRKILLLPQKEMLLLQKKIATEDFCSAHPSLSSSSSVADY